MRGGIKILALVSSIIVISMLLYSSCGDKSTTSTPCVNLSVQTIGWGTVTVSPQAECYNEGTQVTLTASADQGWVVDGWVGDATGSSNPLTITVGQSNLTVIARFALEDYTLATNIDPLNTGTVQLDPDQTAYHLNDVVSITAIPTNGYFFDRWSGDTASTSNPLEVTIVANTSVNAHFFGSGPDSVTLNGTITWPGHTLSYPILVLFDPSFNILGIWDIPGGSASADFSVKFSINDIPQSYIHAVDNLDNDNIIFETGEPWNCYDDEFDGDNLCDYFTYASGEIIDNIDIVLYGGGLSSKNSRDEIEPIEIRR